MNDVMNALVDVCQAMVEAEPETQTLLATYDAALAEIRATPVESEVGQAAWGLINRYAERMFLYGWRLGRNPDQLLDLPNLDA